MTLQFHSLSEFMAMGGYGFYVWLAYGVTFFSCGILIWLSKRDIHQTLQKVKKLQQRDIYLKTGIDE